MLDEELKKIWNASTQQERVKLDKALLLQDVDSQLQRLERGIKIRNTLEIGVAVILLPMFLFVAFVIPFLYTKIGALILVAFCILIIYKLKKVRAYKPKNLALPLKEYLQEQRMYLHKEMQLLVNVAYWYIAPFFTGIVLFFLGFNEIGVPGLEIKIAGCFILGVIIYFINRHAVNKTFKPLIERLDQTIAGLQV